MTIPWQDVTIASIDGPGGREILAEGLLQDILPALSLRSHNEQQRIVIAFPDRTTPPYRLDGAEIGRLSIALHARRRQALEAASRQL